MAELLADRVIKRIGQAAEQLCPYRIGVSPTVGKQRGPVQGGKLIGLDLRLSGIREAQEGIVDQLVDKEPAPHLEGKPSVAVNGYLKHEGELGLQLHTNEFEFGKQARVADPLEERGPDRGTSFEDHPVKAVQTFCDRCGELSYKPLHGTLPECVFKTSYCSGWTPSLMPLSDTQQSTLGLRAIIPLYEESSTWKTAN